MTLLPFDATSPLRDDWIARMETPAITTGTFDTRPWEPIGAIGEDGISLPFSPDEDPAPVSQPGWSRDAPGMGEGEKATLILVGLLAVIHLAVAVGLIVDIFWP